MNSAVAQIATCLLALSACGAPSADAAPLMRAARQVDDSNTLGLITPLVVPVSTLYPGILAGGSDSVSPMAVAGVQPAEQSSSDSGTANLRVAAGITSGVLDPAIVPRGDIFTTFDARPDANGNVRGFQSRQPWTPESVQKTIGTSSVDTDPHIKSNTITSDEDMVTALNFAAQFNGAFLGKAGKVEASFGYSSETSTQKHTVSGYTYGTMSLPGKMLARLDQLQLQPDALGLLQAGNIDGFIATYGSHFIKTHVYGCESSAVYTFSCTTESARNSIEAALQGSYQGGKSWSISASVSTSFSQYSSTNICEYSGEMYSSGLDVISPSKSQMLDNQIMNTYWNSFAQNCQASAATDGKLLFVELGNWLEVDAVRAALGTNQTVHDMLDFYGTMQPADLYALGLAGMYQHKVAVAAANLQPAHMKPWATTGFFDRQTGTGMPAVDPSYWANLPTAHQNIVQALGTSGFANFVNDNTIAAAIASGQTMSQLVQKYFANAKSLYQQAAQIYMYTYAGVRAVFMGFDTDNKTPISSSAYVPSGAAQAVVPPAGADGYTWVAWTDTHAGNVALSYGIGLAPASTRLVGYFGTTQFGSPTYRYLDAQPSSASDHTTQDFFDLSDFFHSAPMCPSCPAGPRMDLSVLYTMPDVSFNVDPYLV